MPSRRLQSSESTGILSYKAKGAKNPAISFSDTSVDITTRGLYPSGKKEKTTPPPERRPKSLSKFILYSRGHGGLDVVRIRDVAGERQLLHAELGVDGLRVLLQEIHTAGQGRNGQNEEKSLLSYPETIILLLFGFNN